MVPGLDLGKPRRRGITAMIDFARLPHQNLGQRNNFTPKAFSQHLPDEGQILFSKSIFGKIDARNCVVTA